MTDSKENVVSLLAVAIDNHQSGRIDEAAEGYALILAKVPDHPDALHLSGLVAFQRGDLLHAESSIKSAIIRDATQPLYHANLGRVEMALGHHEDAIKAWQKALTLDPQSTDIHSDISGAFLKLNKADDALDYANKALAFSPDHPMAMMNKGLAHGALNQTDQAITTLSNAAECQPDDAEIWFQLGNLYQQTDNMEQADLSYIRAVNLSPTHFMSQNNLGNILREQGRFDEALLAYKRSLEVDASQSDTHSNLGVTYQEMGNTPSAIKSYREAVRLDPENAEARRNLGMGLLQVGDYSEGWKEYEWRWKTEHFKPIVRNWPKPRWLGQTELDRSLLVHCEQGFGDSIQFSRYLPLVAAKFNKVIVEAPSELKDLLGRIDGVAQVVVRGEDLPDYDLHIPLLSLPYIFQTNERTIPSEVPYLIAGPEKTKVWGKRINKLPGQKLIGIVWQGNQLHQRDQMRSPGLNAFEPLVKSAPQIRFVSLQKDHDDTRSIPGEIEDYTTDLHSFDDTAALISNLDVVVSPDTVVAHLAGALGVETFVTLPYVAEWRWLQNRTDSPWYPKTTLVRQLSPNDWASCINFIGQKLSG